MDTNPDTILENILELFSLHFLLKGGKESTNYTIFYSVHTPSILPEQLNFSFHHSTKHFSNGFVDSQDPLWQTGWCTEMVFGEKQLPPWDILTFPVPVTSWEEFSCYLWVFLYLTEDSGSHSFGVLLAKRLLLGGATVLNRLLWTDGCLRISSHPHVDQLLLILCLQRYAFSKAWFNQQMTPINSKLWISSITIKIIIASVSSA